MNIERGRIRKVDEGEQKRIDGREVELEMEEEEEGENVCGVEQLLASAWEGRQTRRRRPGGHQHRACQLYLEELMLK